MLPKIGIESFPSIPSNPGNDFFFGGGKSGAYTDLSITNSWMRAFYEVCTNQQTD